MLTPNKGWYQALEDLQENKNFATLVLFTPSLVMMFKWSQTWLLCVCLHLTLTKNTPRLFYVSAFSLSPTFGACHHCFDTMMGGRLVLVSFVIVVVSDFYPNANLSSNRGYKLMHQVEIVESLRAWIQNQVEIQSHDNISSLRGGRYTQSKTSTIIFYHILI